MIINQEPIKAFLVTCPKWGDLQMVYPARSHGHAKGIACYNAQMAGFDVLFIDFRARRVPEFDEVAQEAVGKMPWCLGWRDGGETWGCLA